VNKLNDPISRWRRGWLFGAPLVLLFATVFAKIFWLSLWLPGKRLHSVYPNHPNYSRAVFIFGCMAAYFAAYGLLSAACGKTKGREKMMYLVIWSVGPPLFFFAEWFVLFPIYGDPGSVDVFKNCQEAARNLWAGILASFAILQFTDKAQTTSVPAPAPVPVAEGK
jgi:hypothetical protein